MENPNTVYGGALELLPYAMRAPFSEVPEDEKENAEEIRLRIGRRASLLLPDGEKEIVGAPVSARDLECVFEIASRASVHSVSGSIANGYVTAPGGYRVGFCGTAALSDGKMTGFRSISSAAVRIPHEIKGAADGIMKELFSDGIKSVLIVSSPGAGKTTLLRDALRQLSDSGVRVSAADERGELAAVCAGVPQMDVGEKTDVLDACPKAQAVMLLLRCLNPQVIAMDEITSPEDVAAINSAAGCGVRLLATAHAESLEDLRARPVYKRLLKAGIFDSAVFITKKPGGARKYECIPLKREG